MNNKMVALMLIAMGIALLLWGYDSYSTTQAEISRGLGGGLPTQALVGFIAGAMNLFVGVMKLRK